MSKDQIISTSPMAHFFQPNVNNSSPNGYETAPSFNDDFSCVSHTASRRLLNALGECIRTWSLTALTLVCL